MNPYALLLLAVELAGAALVGVLVTWVLSAWWRRQDRRAMLARRAALARSIEARLERYRQAEADESRNVLCQLQRERKLLAETQAGE